MSSGTDANVGTGMDVGASLANQDVAGEDKLAVGAFDTKAFDSESLTVLGGTDTFL